MLSSPHGGGLIGVGGRRSGDGWAAAEAVAVCISWQPTQPRCSPGISPVKLRMVCKAR